MLLAGAMHLFREHFNKNSVKLPEGIEALILEITGLYQAPPPGLSAPRNQIYHWLDFWPEDSTFEDRHLNPSFRFLSNYFNRRSYHNQLPSNEAGVKILFENSVCDVCLNSTKKKPDACGHILCDKCCEDLLAANGKKIPHIPDDEDWLTGAEENIHDRPFGKMYSSEETPVNKPKQQYDSIDATVCPVCYVVSIQRSREFIMQERGPQMTPEQQAILTSAIQFTDPVPDRSSRNNAARACIMQYSASNLGCSNDHAMLKLRRAVCLYKLLKHPNIAELIAYQPTTNFFLTIFFIELTDT
jgi:hypothetical protein